MRSVFNDMAREFDFRPVAPENHERFRDLQGRELLAALGLPLWKVPRVVNAMRRRMSQHAGSFTLFPGVRDVLERLATSGIQIAIVSSNSRENVQRILGPSHSKLINHFACGASIFGKATKLRSVLRASRISAAAAIYIGDEVRDVEAARAAGIAFGAVVWGQHSVTALQAQRPQVFFHSVSDIAKELVERD
jgi:phosphoglycolate phosphatase